ncbi:endolytic transglycosylase MltG [Streptomyces endophyticus]|uniref:Endolytic murein transglycosylase n=1 Tax=Streptomyces endophyticus TaxID=714166 RepID=A0ABU6EX64_9ACTN|nr:endolytic transglycosylase MltG [Streptomyces endophyticus]MEB8335957.1 endolytic transglycosylase MltG [Streptomyces endophyticus]
MPEDKKDPADQGTEKKRRLSRRGRLIVVAVVALAVVAAVVVPLVVIFGGKEPTRSEKLVIPEGYRASQVYEAVDKALAVDDGTTKKAAANVHFTLPSAADGNPEGYLFPATYPVDKNTTPTSLLAYMNNTANQRLKADHVTEGSDKNGVSVYETVVIASIVQAEADTHEDMGKVARVIYNRLDQGMPLQMDSTINYALNRSTLDTSHADTRTDSPYNTYAHKGLPPTPIGNPGQDALDAAIAPPKGDWLYFVTVAPGDTRFTDSYEEQKKNVEEFNSRQASAKE